MHRALNLSDFEFEAMAADSSAGLSRVLRKAFDGGPPTPKNCRAEESSEKPLPPPSNPPSDCEGEADDPPKPCSSKPPQQEESLKFLGIVFKVFFQPANG